MAYDHGVQSRRCEGIVSSNQVLGCLERGLEVGLHSSSVINVHRTIVESLDGTGRRGRESGRDGQELCGLLHDDSR